MLEGIITIFFGLIAALYLPADVSTPRSFLGRRWSLFTAREAEVITLRVDRDDPTKFERAMRRFSFADIVRGLSDWRIYGHCIAAFLSSVTISPINTYAPSLLKSLGFAGYVRHALPPLDGH